MKKAPLPLLVGGGILLITSGDTSSGINITERLQKEGKLDKEVIQAITAGVVGMICCLALAFFVISSWVRVGFANSVANVLRTGNTEVSQIFDGKGRIGPMLLVRLLAGVIMFATMIPLFIAVGVLAAVTGGFERGGEMVAVVLIGGFLLTLPVGIYIGLGLSLSGQAVALEGLGPVESVKRSWSLVNGHRWMLLWYTIVTAFVAFVGVCACCVGVFLTATMAEAAKSDSFLALTRGTERDGWWVRTKVESAAPEPQWGAPAASQEPASSGQPPTWGAPPPPPPPMPS